MAEENVNAGEVALPTAHVLSYLTATGSPTRVRRVASVGMYVVGAIILIFLFPLMMNLFHVLRVELTGGVHRLDLDSLIDDYKESLFDTCRGWGLPWPLIGIMQELDWCGVFSIALTLFGVCNGGVLIFFAEGVNLGKRTPSKVAALALVPIILILIAVSAIFGGWGICNMLGIGSRANSVGILWLLTLVMWVPCLMILLDLVRYLKWIVRNPMTEKPPVAFLPGNAS